MSQREETYENKTKLRAQERYKPNETSPEDNEVNVHCISGRLTSNMITTRIEGVEMSSRAQLACANLGEEVGLA
jgi:hypothetical protein